MNTRPNAYEIPSYQLALMWRQIAKKSQQSNPSQGATHA